VWSSYRATVGAVPTPGFLDTDWVLRAFAEERVAAVAGYRGFDAAACRTGADSLQAVADISASAG